MKCDLGASGVQSSSIVTWYAQSILRGSTCASGENVIQFLRWKSSTQYIDGEQAELGIQESEMIQKSVGRWREDLLESHLPQRLDLRHRAVPCERELIDYKTIMITDEDPLRGLLFYQDLGFSPTLHSHFDGQIDGV